MKDSSGPCSESSLSVTIFDIERICFLVLYNVCTRNSGWPSTDLAAHDSKQPSCLLLSSWCALSTLRKRASTFLCDEQTTVSNQAMINTQYFSTNKLYFDYRVNEPIKIQYEHPRDTQIQLEMLMVSCTNSPNACFSEY